MKKYEMESPLTIHIMADSCNGEEKAFSQYCRSRGYAVVLHRESGVSPAEDDEREIGNQLWAEYCERQNKMKY